MWLLVAWLNLGDVIPTLTDFPLQPPRFELWYFQREILEFKNKKKKAAAKKYYHVFSAWE